MEEWIEKQKVLHDKMPEKEFLKAHWDLDCSLFKLSKKFDVSIEEVELRQASLYEQLSKEVPVIRERIDEFLEEFTIPQRRKILDVLRGQGE